MLCCAIILALLGAPLVALKAMLKPANGDPLAWRLSSGTGNSTSAITAAPPRRGFFKTRARSFVFAGAGVWHVATSEQSSVIHGAATVIAIACGWMLDITAADWRWIISAMVVVWSAEAFNTAIENTCNLLLPHFDDRVRVAKDAAAGAVLLVSCGAAIVGAMTFWPYLRPLISTVICGTAL